MKKTKKPKQPKKPLSKKALSIILLSLTFLLSAVSSILPIENRQSAFALKLDEVAPQDIKAPFAHSYQK